MFENKDEKKDKNEPLSLMQMFLTVSEGLNNFVVSKVLDSEVDAKATSKAISRAYQPAQRMLSGAKIMNSDDKAQATVEEGSLWGCTAAGAKAGSLTGTGFLGAAGGGIAAGLLCEKAIDDFDEREKSNKKSFKEVIKEQGQKSKQDTYNGWLHFMNPTVSKFDFTKPRR